VGTDRSTSIREVVQIVADSIGTGKQIEFGTFKNVGSKADTDHQLDTKRIRSALGWHPEVSIEDGLHRTIKAFQ
jgi:nucleoside-diphosphate-sugar epimerase